jgi:hypothetical protein
MADVLSQTEVESLLSSLDGGSQKPQGGGPKKEPARGSISVYDFKRPERVSKEQMRGFQALHDGFSRELGAALSSMLRSIVEVKLISVDQLTYSEFVLLFRRIFQFRGIAGASQDMGSGPDESLRDLKAQTPARPRYDRGSPLKNTAHGRPTLK